MHWTRLSSLVRCRPRLSYSGRSGGMTVGWKEECGTCMKNRWRLSRDSASAATLVAPGVGWAETPKSKTPQEVSQEGAVSQLSADELGDCLSGTGTSLSTPAMFVPTKGTPIQLGKAPSLLQCTSRTTEPETTVFSSRPGTPNCLKRPINW